jgi:hypothetical protein
VQINSVLECKDVVYINRKVSSFSGLLHKFGQDQGKGAESFPDLIPQRLIPLCITVFLISSLGRQGW